MVMKVSFEKPRKLWALGARSGKQWKHLTQPGNKGICAGFMAERTQYFSEIVVFFGHTSSEAFNMRSQRFWVAGGKRTAATVQQG
jgi:hypothetical protein